MSFAEKLRENLKSVLGVTDDDITKQIRDLASKIALYSHRQRLYYVSELIRTMLRLLPPDDAVLLLKSLHLDYQNDIRQQLAADIQDAHLDPDEPWQERVQWGG